MTRLKMPAMRCPSRRLPSLSHSGRWTPESGPAPPHHPQQTQHRRLPERWSLLHNWRPQPSPSGLLGQGCPVDLETPNTGGIGVPDPSCKSYPPHVHRALRSLRRAV